MATLVHEIRLPTAADDRFFLRAAIAMSVVIIAGFSLQLAMGRSSFAAPAMVHAHAVVFMGWIAIYVLQNIFVTRGNMVQHRTLGWIAAWWIVAMLILGIMVTVDMVRRGHVPFFFRPLHFIVFDPVSLFTFAGLTAAAIAMRKRTDWHRRLHLCGTALLIGPGFGRLMPMPLLQPFAFEATFAAVMLFPLAGVISDKKRTGNVHPAWRWGIGAMLVSLLVTEAITYSPIGTALYDVVTAGSPGADVPPLDFAPPPPTPLMTGRP